MPKREKSPDAADDARYFTVYTPYPLNPNWADEEDQKACAVWFAECVGPTHLWAIHNKPSSRGMMLLEVSKAFEDHASLLGEHRWSEFLKDPTDEEKGRSTQVFHSFYVRGREAQKDGWKVIVVQSEWFDDWAPGTDRIKHPYPNTHWCSTPVEDQTNKPLCRPLPAETKPPPPRAQSTVVGSSIWAAKQTESALTKAELASAWSGGDAQMAQVTEQAPTMSSSSSLSIHPRSPILSEASMPVSPGRKGKFARGRAVPLQEFVSGAVRVKSKKTGWAAVQPTASSAKPPLAEEAPKGPVNAWVKPLNVPASQRSQPAPAPKIDSQWASTETDYGAWKSDAALEDVANGNASTPDPPSTSTPPASPRKGRTQDRKERRDRPALSSRKDHISDNHNGSSRRESTSRAPSDQYKRDELSANARSDHDRHDIMTPQREKRRGWDVPSPEQSSKPTPKPRDKKKKKKETIETLESGSPVPKTPDLKGSKGSSRALPSSKALKVKVEKDDQGLSQLKTPDVKLKNESASASKSKSPEEITDAKLKGKAKEVVQVDFSSKSEDWGGDAVPEQSPANTSETTKATSDYDNDNWGALQGGSSDKWGLSANPFPSTAYNLEEVEFHTWEENTSAVRSAKDPPTASASELSKKYLKSLKCPTHKCHCNKNICKDMARLMKEEETKLRDRVTNSDGKGRKTAGRPIGSKRGPGPKREAQTTDGDAKPKVGHLTMESSGRKPRKEKKEGRNEEGAKEGSTPDASNSWGAPIGSRVEEWGPQSSLEAWM